MDLIIVINQLSWCCDGVGGSEGAAVCNFNVSVISQAIVTVSTFLKAATQQ